MNVKRALFALALAAPLFAGASAKAAFLTGSVAFSSDTTTITMPAGGNSVLTATAFQFSTANGGVNTQDTAAPATGSFSGLAANTVIGSSQLTLGSTPYLTLTLGSDSFTATTLLSDRSAAANARTIELLGTIAGPGFTTTPGDFILQFSQSGGPGNAIGYSGSLAAVPEPASVALAAVGMAAIGLAGLRRRAR